ncbi:DUF3727 domain-containing protein [Synechococcus sp. CS-1328]|uniref:DUF3727 domain-containing protein n=1 Tax=Synechococcus sp. CS-1328 TaxID=2847976 RepID=UPI00223B7B77|nr:DUF3727 domain-containing protein [Synechococcus sp. CS-1328]MCT0226500.1 DUF3727 domain-containing protein [Synechococcus sp. CS-1328]
MSPDGPTTPSSGDVPTVLVRDSQQRQLLCFLEQLIPLDGHDYGLLTPVDTPVCLFRLTEDETNPDLIDTIEGNEEIFSVADVVLQEHDLTLVRSAVTLTVSGELDEPDPEEYDEEEEDEDTEMYEPLIQFMADGQEYGLFIPLDPFFVVARMSGSEAVLVEGEEFERIQPRLEAELEEREQGD